MTLSHLTFVHAFLSTLEGSIVLSGCDGMFHKQSHSCIMKFTSDNSDTDLTGAHSIFSNTGNWLCGLKACFPSYASFLILFSLYIVWMRWSLFQSQQNITVHIYCHWIFYRCSNSTKIQNHSQAQPSKNTHSLPCSLTPSYVTVLNIGTLTVNITTWCRICEPQTHICLNHALCLFVIFTEQVTLRCLGEGNILNRLSILFWKSATFWKGGWHD